MSIREVFMVWGQNTRQRTQKALERADFEMRQLNISEQARIDRLMKLVDMKQKRLRSLRSQRSKLKAAYEKTHGPKQASMELSRAYGTFAKFADILSSVDYNKVKGFMDFSEDYDKKFDREAAHQTSLIDFQTLFTKEYPSLASKDANDLRTWLQSQSELGKLNATIDLKGGGAAPVNQELVNDIVDDLYAKMSSGTTPNLSKEVVQKIFIDETGATELMDAQTKANNKTAGMKRAWKDDARHIDVPDETLWAYRSAYKDLKKIREAAPPEAQVVLDKELDDIPNLISEISKTETELEKAATTPYDYGAVQKRAGEILLAQESVQKIKDLPDEEVEYLQSLPEAFKYEKMESLDKQGEMGKFVQAMMSKEQEKLPWPLLLGRVRQQAGEDENKYRRGREMVASRILRAGRSAQGLQDVKRKAENAIAVSMLPSPAKTAAAPAKLPPAQTVAAGTVLKRSQNYNYGYKVAYGADGQPTFTLVVKDQEKTGTLDQKQQDEALELWKAQQ